MSNLPSDRNKVTESSVQSQPAQSYNAEQTARAIKDIARRIREESAKMKETVRIIRQSGAIQELTEAVKEASLAARDTSREISDAARELKERGVIRDTAVAIDDTAKNAKDTARTVSGMSQQAKDAAPEVSAGLSKGLDTAKEKLRRDSEAEPT